VSHATESKGRGTLVVLKSYFDAGNKADSREYDVLFLAALSATEDEWGPFE